MALTTPIVNSVVAFDATEAHLFTFTSSGGDQIVKNEIEIINNTTSAVVYTNILETYQLSQAILADTLTNGVYYAVRFRTYNVSDETSAWSSYVAFYCYTTPTLSFNVTEGQTVGNASFDFELTYDQLEDELIDYGIIYLYSATNTLLESSGNLSDTSTPPLTLTYMFEGMENNTTYKVKGTVVTIEGTTVETDLISFTVEYTLPTVYSTLEVTAHNCDGYNEIDSNIVAIDGISNPTPPNYVGETVEMVTSVSDFDDETYSYWVKWNDGFEIPSDFVLRYWFTPAMIDEKILRLYSSTTSEYVEVNYVRSKEYDYVNVTTFSGSVVTSNPILCSNGNDKLFLFVKVVDNAWDVQLDTLERVYTVFNWNDDNNNINYNMSSNLAYVDEYLGDFITPTQVENSLNSGLDGVKIGNGIAEYLNITSDTSLTYTAFQDTFYANLTRYEQENTKLIDDFNDDGLWTIGAGTKSSDTTNIKIGTQSLKIEENDALANTLYAYRNVSLDLSTFNSGDSSSTNDYIYMIVYVSNVDAINTVIQIQLSQGTNGDQTNTIYYSVFKADLVNGWNYVKILKSDFAVAGTGAWNGINSIKVVWDTVASSLGEYVSFQLLQLVRSNSALTYPNPFQKDGVDDFTIIDGQWYVGKENGVTVMKEIGDVNDDYAIISTNILDDFVISGKFKTDGDINKGTQIYKDSDNYLSTFLYDNTLVMQKFEDGVYSEVTTTMPYTVDDEVVYNMTSINGDITLRVYKNDDYDTEYTLTDTFNVNNVMLSVNNYIVGGRNLVLTSGGYTTSSVTEWIIDYALAWTKTLNDGYVTFTRGSYVGGSFIRLPFSETLDTSKQYTISIRCRCNNSKSGTLFAFTSSLSEIGNGISSTLTANEWKTITYTFTPTYEYFQFFATASWYTADSDILDIEYIMLTEGSTVYTWRNAPEDYFGTAFDTYYNPQYHSDITVSGEWLQTPSTPTWDFNTILDCNFNENINGGNINVVLSQITQIFVKRRDENSTSWTTIYEKDVTTADDLEINIIDSSTPTLVEQTYAIVPILEGGVEGDYITQTVTPDWDGVFISDGSTVFKLYNAVAYGETSQNVSNGLLMPIGATYPIVIQNSANNYQGGSLTAQLCGYNFESTRRVDRADVVKQSNDFLQFMANSNAKFLIDWNGNSIVIRNLGQPSKSFASNYGNGVVTVSFSWVEQGKYNNETDLRNNGLIQEG